MYSVIGGSLLVHELKQIHMHGHEKVTRYRPHILSKWKPLLIKAFDVKSYNYLTSIYHHICVYEGAQWWQSIVYKASLNTFFIRPFEKRTYYAAVMSVRLSVRPSEFSGLFSTGFEISI